MVLPVYTLSLYPFTPLPFPLLSVVESQAKTGFTTPWIPCGPNGVKERMLGPALSNFIFTDADVVVFPARSLATRVVS